MVQNDVTDMDEHTQHMWMFGPVLLLSLSLTGVLCTVTCSWMVGRKKRQRVGNTHREMTRETSLKSPDHYAKLSHHKRLQSQSDDAGDLKQDAGQSLAVPTIVVTPPSPQGGLASAGRSTSLDSLTSIGSADDLDADDDDDQFAEIVYFQNETENDTRFNENIARGAVGPRRSVASSQDAGLTRDRFVRDSMRNTFHDPKPQGNGTSAHKTTANNGGCSSEIIVNKHGNISYTTQEVIGEKGSGDDSEDDFFNLENMSARPRLGSMDPGTKRDSFHLPYVDKKS